MVVVHTFNASLGGGGQRQIELCEFEVNPVYSVSSGIPGLEKQTNK